MKNVLFFITHKTLTEEHADLTFKSISNQINNDKKFDYLYIYNTHQNELTNEYLINLYNQYELNRFFIHLEIFPYSESTQKSLAGDFDAIRSWCTDNLEETDRVLILKSDCLLSVNYFSEILNLSQENLIYFVSPFICAKKRVSNDEIIEYSKRETYIASDEITFFVEDINQTDNNDFKNKKDITVNDEKIKFTSCYVIRDFSCHYLSVGLLGQVNISFQSWGGINFSNLQNYHIKTDKCFVIHKYHDIISENRSTDREGPVREWLNS
jgi:hypothetical protein